jgi:hypothetical protein
MVPCPSHLHECMHSCTQFWWLQTAEAKHGVKQCCIQSSMWGNTKMCCIAVVHIFHAGMTNCRQGAPVPLDERAEAAAQEVRQEGAAGDRVEKQQDVQSRSPAKRT